jgi:tyrosyl-tRNA synthetase
VNTTDEDVVRMLKLFTFLPMERIEELARLQGAELREAKQILAYEVTKIVHGETEAKKARQAAEAAFSGGGGVDGIPTSSIPKAELEQGVAAFQLFVKTGLCKSSSDARRLVKQGGAYVGDDRVSNFDQLITLDMADDDGAIRLRAGKKKHHRVVPE